MALIIPALIQGYFTVVQGVDQGLSFSTKGTAVTLLLFRCRFALWGSVSMAAFNANFICSAGRDCTAFDHRLAPSGVAALIIYPCFSRLFGSVSLLTSSACWVALSATEQAGYITTLITLEVGSRGVPHLPGFTTLAHELAISQRDLSSLLHQCCQAAITGSYKIWCTRNRLNL